MTRHLVLSLLLCTALALTGCAPDKASLAGAYASQGDIPVTLTLKENGKGSWSTDLDEIEFKWSLRKDGQFWVHTNEGGVIQGTAQDNLIELSLPGVGEIKFVKEY